MLAKQVEELMLTLGQRPHVAYYKRSGFGLEVDSWTVEITPVGVNPFRLPRKADQAAASTKNLTMSSRRVITSVEPGPDVETACIAVDSWDHLYLAGERMIPTHNTGKDLSYGWLEISVQLATYANATIRFDKEKKEWTPMPGPMDLDVALVVHLPATEPGETVKATMYAVDIAAGKEMAQLCTDVRQARKRKGLATALAVIEEPGVMPVTVASRPLSPADLGPAPEEAPFDRRQDVIRPPSMIERAQQALTEADLQAVWFDAVRTRQDTKQLADAIKARKQAILAETAAG
jgi:hypothetical protein